MKSYVKVYLEAPVHITNFDVLDPVTRVPTKVKWFEGTALEDAFGDLDLDEAN